MEKPMWETNMITSEIVNKGIDYIMEHLAEEITVEDVAKHCHFSKYYFSRMFKAETGESIYAFIKRLKLDQSAVHLKI
jgi:AraC family transcriptional regulator